MLGTRQSRPVHPGHRLVAGLVGAVEGGEVGAVGGRAVGGDGARVGEPAHAVAACRLEHGRRAHHVDTGAGDGVRAAEGHLQRREMKDRANPVRRYRPVHGLVVGDVALFPGHPPSLLLRQEQARPVAARIEIEGDGGHACPYEDGERPAPDAPARAGHEHWSVEVLSAGGEALLQRVHDLSLLLWIRICAGGDAHGRPQGLARAASYTLSYTLRGLRAHAGPSLVPGSGALPAGGLLATGAARPQVR